MTFVPDLMNFLVKKIDEDSTEVFPEEVLPEFLRALTDEEFEEATKWVDAIEESEAGAVGNQSVVIEAIVFEENMRDAN